MSNKTCEVCAKCQNRTVVGTCEHIGITNTNIPACSKFEPKVITKGDRIRQMNNEGIAAFVCGVLNDRREETFRSALALINAPAEIEGEDE